MTRALPLLLALALAAVATPAAAVNPIVRMTTVLGNMDVELCTEISDACPGVAPITVANFLRYVDAGRYLDTMFVHRRGAGGASPLVVQSGGYWIGEDEIGYYFGGVAKYDPIVLELGENLSNVRGTIAMARTAAPDTATSQWFINLVDNTSLDTAGGGYAVFGKVVSGLDVLDAIGDLTIYRVSALFTELPLLDTFPVGSPTVVPYLVYVSSVARVPEPGSLAGAAMAVLALVHLKRRRSG